MFPIPEADKCSKGKGNCTEASSTARYQPVARARRALPGPSGESNGASHCVQGKQRDSTATSSDEEVPPPPRRKKSHGPKRQ